MKRVVSVSNPSHGTSAKIAGRKSSSQHLAKLNQQVEGVRLCGCLVLAAFIFVGGINYKMRMYIEIEQFLYVCCDRRLKLC